MTASERIQTYVKAHPRCTSTDIAEALALPSANVAATLSSLASRGQVQRHTDSRPIRWSLPGVELPGVEHEESPTPGRSADEIESARILDDLEAREEQRAMAAAEEDGGDSLDELRTAVSDTGEDLGDDDPEPEGDILPVASEILMGGDPPPRPANGQLTMLRRRVSSHSDRALMKLREAIDLRLDEQDDPLLSALLDSYLEQLHVRTGLD